MSRVIGSTRSWLWWAAGLLCALVFGRSAGGGEPGKCQAEYGIRVRPPAKQPAVTEAERQQAAKLVDEYLAGRGGAEPGAEPGAGEKAQIAKLIADLGADEYAAREAASKEIVKFGFKALAQLREALKSGDAEVVQRAGAAIAGIQKGGRGRLIGALRKVRGAAQLVIRERMQKHRAEAYQAKLNALALQSQGKSEEAEAQRRLEAAAAGRIGEMAKLSGLVLYGGQVPVPVKGVAVRYGVRALK